MPTSRVSVESIESFCKNSHGAMKLTTRSIAQEQKEEAVDIVREVLEDDLYQDPLQVKIICCVLLLFCCECR